MSESKQINFTIVPDETSDATRTYANFCAVNHTPFDFTLTFCEMAPLSEKDIRAAESEHVVRAPVKARVDAAGAGGADSHRCSAGTDAHLYGVGRKPRSWSGPLNRNRPEETAPRKSGSRESQARLWSSLAYHPQAVRAAPRRRYRARLSRTLTNCSSRPFSRRSRPTPASIASRRPFSRAIPNAAALAKATADELEPLIHSTGFYRSKAKSLMGMAAALVEHHAGEVPRTMEALVELPGVGRKTANVVLGHALGIPGLPVDRHVLRVSNRIGIASSDDPVEVEQQLGSALPPAEWTKASDTLILHGRRICKPKPLCDQCVVRDDCDFYRTLVGGAEAKKTATVRLKPDTMTCVARASASDNTFSSPSGPTRSSTPSALPDRCVSGDRPGPGILTLRLAPESRAPRRHRNRSRSHRCAHAEASLRTRRSCPATCSTSTSTRALPTT